jgi:hypothetical protein
VAARILGEFKIPMTSSVIKFATCRLCSIVSQPTTLPPAPSVKLVNVKSKGKVAPVLKHYAVKTYGGMVVSIHVSLISTLVGGEWSALRPCRSTSGEEAPGTNGIGGWVGPRAGVDDMEKRKFLILPGLELRSLGRRARSQSLYRMSYPGSSVKLAYGN